MIEMIAQHPKLSYLSNKPDKSPMAIPLTPELSRAIGNYIRFYAGHYPPESQGLHGYIHEVTRAATCATNRLICESVNSSLSDEMKMPFADMFDAFDDLCPMKAPLKVDGVKFDFKKHFLDVLSDEERARWKTLTIDHIKWKYVDAIDHGVNKAIVLIFGKRPGQYWPDIHKRALDQAGELFLTEGREVLSSRLS